jgi:hypothetical protein
MVVPGALLPALRANHRSRLVPTYLNLHTPSDQIQLGRPNFSRLADPQQLPVMRHGRLLA